MKLMERTGPTNRWSEDDEVLKRGNLEGQLCLNPAITWDVKG